MTNEELIEKLELIQKFKCVNSYIRDKKCRTRDAQNIYMTHCLVFPIRMMEELLFLLKYLVQIFPIDRFFIVEGEE